MPRRLVIAHLTPVRWAPLGHTPSAWRRAMAEDVVDLVAALAAASGAIAVGRGEHALAAAVGWPRMPVYEVDGVRGALAAAHADGYDEAAVITGDAPDLPGLLVGKLLQPLGSRHAAVAPATDGGLFGVAARLPVPEWFPELDLDAAGPDDLRAAAPRRALVAVTPGWHRLRGPADLARLDPGLDGWEATRALLTSRR